MLTKAIILSIDYNTNMCSIRIPLFETVANINPIVASAPINIPPGLYNGLKVNDVVFIGFEENKIEKPVILGKLYLGAGTESLDSRGVANFSSLNVLDNATLPQNTKIVLEDQNLIDYNSFLKLIQKVKELETSAKLTQYLTILQIKWDEGAHGLLALKTTKPYGKVDLSDTSNSNILDLFSNIFISTKYIEVGGYPIDYFIWTSENSEDFDLKFIKGETFSSFSLYDKNNTKIKEVNESNVLSIQSIITSI